MRAIRHGDGRAVVTLAPRRSEKVDPAAGTGRRLRRIAEPPGAAVVLAPLLGLFLWGGLIALLVF